MVSPLIAMAAPALAQIAPQVLETGINRMYAYQDALFLPAAKQLGQVASSGIARLGQKLGLLPPQQKQVAFQAQPFGQLSYGMPPGGSQAHPFAQVGYGRSPTDRGIAW